MLFRRLRPRLSIFSESVSTQELEVTFIFSDTIDDVDTVETSIYNGAPSSIDVADVDVVSNNSNLEMVTTAETTDVGAINNWETNVALLVGSETGVTVKDMDAEVV